MKDNFPNEPKANCVHCGAGILLRTYTSNHGFCLRCNGGMSRSPLAAPGFRLEERQVVDESTAWSLVTPISATRPASYHLWLRLLAAREPGDHFVRYRGSWAFPPGSVSFTGLVVMRGDEAIGEFVTSWVEEAEEPAVADGTEIQPPDTGPEPVVAKVEDPRQLWLALHV